MPDDLVHVSAGSDLLLYGFVGDAGPNSEGFTTSAVAQALEGRSGPLTVRLNSGGGDAFAGEAIRAQLARYPGRVTVVIEGVAASAASLVAMAADELVMTEGSVMMIHDPSLITVGTAADHEAGAAMLDKLGGVYAAAYGARTGMPKAQVRQLMLAETWFTPEEAVQAGFADRIEGAARIAAAFPYPVYANAPARLRALAMSNGWGPTQEPDPARRDDAPIPSMETQMTGKNPAAEPAENEAPPGLTASQQKRVVAMAARLGLPASLPMQIFDEGVTMEVAQARLIDAKAETGDQHEYSKRPHVEMGVSFEGKDALRAKLVDGLQARLDSTHKPTMGADYAGHSLSDFCVEIANAAGQRPRNRSEAVEMAMGGFASSPTMAHTTSDFTFITADALSNVVGRQLEQRMPAIARLSRELPRDTYHSGKMLTLSASGMPEEVAESGELKFTTMAEKGEEAPTPRDFGAVFSISNKAIVNDNVGLLAQVGERMVRGSVERLRAVLLEPLLANSGNGQTMASGNPLFDVNHSNVASTGTAISVTALDAARSAMRRQKGLQGEIYAIEPFVLLVPPELETRAQQVVADIAAAKFTDVNPFSGELQIIVEPGLIDTSRWYLVGDPARFDGLAHAFLGGQSTPRIDSRAGWYTMGMEFRLEWAVDAKFVETASWYMNPGV